ncbi:MAG TPA: ABC-2 family transporter protein [Roseiflexaceae bacterium]|nr:ABC-2 family transporter protein [Roseiflexaceae bacterium]
MIVAAQAYVANTRLGYLLFFSYRGRLILKMLSEAILVVALYYLWKAVFGSAGGGTVGGIAFEQFIAYLIAARLVATLVGGPAWGYFSKSVRDGSIMVELTQPLQLEWAWFFRQIGQKAGELTVALPTFVLLALLLGVRQINTANLGWFALSAALAFLCAFLFEMLISLTAFVTTAQQGIHELKALAVALLSGALFPLNLLPPVFAALDWLPFQHFVYTPVRLLTFPPGAVDAPAAVLAQLAWTLVFGAAVALGIGRVRRSYDASGA